MSFEITRILTTVVFVLIILGIYVFYLINLQELLKQCSPENRRVSPANVWLLLIPFFSIVYQFILYPKISDSVEQEFKARGSSVPGDYGRNLGFTISILSVVSLLPMIGSLAGLASLVVLITYWVKTADLKKKLMVLPRTTGGISNRPDLLD